MGCMYAKHMQELEGEVAHLQKEIQYLQQGYTPRPGNKEHLAEETSRKVEHLQHEEVSYDLLTGEQQGQFKQNCLDLVHVEYQLHEIRGDMVDFTKAKRVLELNIARAMDTVTWEEELGKLKASKVDQRKKLKKAGFNLEEFEQRKLNSELASLRISKEKAREHYKLAKLAEQKDVANKNATAEFALKRKELAARRVHQAKEHRESLEGLREVKNEIMMLERSIGDLEEKIKEALHHLQESRCVKVLTKLDKDGTGLLSEPQIVRVLRAQWLMDAVPPPELELLADILSLFNEHGVAPDEAEEARRRLFENMEAHLPAPSTPMGHSIFAKSGAPGSTNDALSDLAEYEHFYVPLSAVVERVLEKHAKSKAQGLSCPAAPIPSIERTASTITSPGPASPLRTGASAGAVTDTLGNDPYSSPPHPPYMSTPAAVESRLGSPSLLLHTVGSVAGAPLSKTPATPATLAPTGTGTGTGAGKDSSGENDEDGDKDKSKSKKDKGKSKKKTAKEEAEAEELRLATALVEAEYREEVDIDPQYFDRLLEAYARLWERDVVYHGVRVLIQRQCLVTLGRDQTLAPEALVKFFQALDRTLRKRYPGEDEAWYGESPEENAHEALRALRDRMHEARTLGDTTTATGAGAALEMLLEERHTHTYSDSVEEMEKGGGHRMIARLKVRVGAFLAGMQLSQLLSGALSAETENENEGGTKQKGKRGMGDGSEGEEEDLKQ